MNTEALSAPATIGSLSAGYTKEDVQILDVFAQKDVSPTPGFVTDFMGCKSRTSILYDKARKFDNQVWAPPTQGAFFPPEEWIGMLKAVLTAQESFSAMELGAGSGPVIVATGHAARMRGIPSIFLCGVEADPGRFILMQQHLRDNGFDPAKHELIMAAVGSQVGQARWPRIEDPQNAAGARPVRAGNRSDASYMQYFKDEAIEVNVVAFSDLLRKRPVWDLVHIDVQGWEFELCQSAHAELNQKAKWLVIGTHSRKIDGDLIALFHNERWVLENERPTVFAYDAALTSLELMTTVDGIQVWRNPKLDASAVSGKAPSLRRLRLVDFGLNGAGGAAASSPANAGDGGLNKGRHIVTVSETKLENAGGSSHSGKEGRIVTDSGMEHNNDSADVAGLRERVFARRWFHRIDLGHGIVTPGVDDSPAKLCAIGMPEDLRDKSVLDIGAFDGFFSFEAERRGASRVVAADSYAWTQPKSLFDGQGFKIAHEALHSRVEQKRIAVEDISPETVGMFDLVLFLGVFYHAPDPFRYLRAAASVCREMMIVETHVDGLDYNRPVMVFYPGATLNNDPTNKWGPNLLCVEALLKEAGFKGGHFLKPYHPSRIVAHAFRQ